jgi:hypothetical protein
MGESVGTPPHLTATPLSILFTSARAMEAQHLLALKIDGLRYSGGAVGAWATRVVAIKRISIVAGKSYGVFIGPYICEMNRTRTIAALRKD